MPKKNAKVGLVSLKQFSDGSWQVRWWDASTRKYIRRKIPATSYTEAVAMAKVYNQDIAGDKGFMPSMRGKAGHTVTDAILEAIDNSDAHGKTKTNYGHNANSFTGWLATYRKGITRWEQITTKCIEDYLTHCEGLNLSFDGIRQRFHVVRATSLYMARVYSERYKNPATGVKLKRAKPTGKIEEDKIVLNPIEARLIVNFAKVNRADLAPIIALQAFAGLRVLEAVHLRRQDVDIEGKTIRVTVTPDHAPKTIASERTIPICAQLVEVLREVIKGRKLILPEPGDYLFTSRYGRVWTLNGITHALKEIYVTASTKLSNPRYKTVFPRRLRSTFVNIIRSARGDYRVLQRYVGHELADVLGTNYERTEMDQMRAEIVTRIDEALARPLPKKNQVQGEGSEEIEKIERTGSDLH